MRKDHFLCPQNAYVEIFTTFAPKKQSFSGGKKRVFWNYYFFSNKKSVFSDFMCTICLFLNTSTFAKSAHKRWHYGCHTVLASGKRVFILYKVAGMTLMRKPFWIEKISQQKISLLFNSNFLSFGLFHCIALHREEGIALIRMKLKNNIFFRRKDNFVFLIMFVWVK